MSGHLFLLTPASLRRVLQFAMLAFNHFFSLTPLLASSGSESSPLNLPTHLRMCLRVDEAFTLSHALKVFRGSGG